MMEKSRKYLFDVLIAIELIEEFIEDKKNFSLYDEDKKTQSAVERQLAIIGEALNQFKKIEQEIKIENEKQIISFRNRLVHSYDNIDNSIIWTIVIRHLDSLKKEIIKLIDV